MGMKTRPVSKYLYMNYLKKADEFFESAKDAHSKGNWNSCVTNSVHAAISSSDSIMIFFKGVRNAGEKREDVISLLRTLDFGEEISKKIWQLQRLLQIKNAAEYEEKLMSQQDAENALRDAERFLGWVKEKVAAK